MYANFAQGRFIIVVFIRSSWVCLLLLQTLSWTSLAWSSEKIVFTCTVNEVNRNYIDLSEIYTEAFAALGYEFEMLTPPAGRGIAMLVSEVVDGDCGRSGRFIEITGMHNLQKVPEPIREVSVSIWTNLPGLKTASLSDVDKQGGRVGYVRGYVGIRSMLDSLSHLEPISLNDTVTGMKMLSANRLDFFVGLDAKIRLEMATLEFKHPIYRSGRLDSTYIYPYLTKKHAHLAVGLAKEIRRINARK
jgi:hypothetical protein